MPEASVRLDDKYRLESGRIFLTGTQALVRLPMMQRQRDLANQLNTACFISGYRGSPLGGLDQQLWKARGFLKENHIHFQPGVNEDLAATAVWGSQQSTLYGDANYDGVFAMWYGKGPGVDRSSDPLRHGNYAGSDRHGGVLVVAGDDHGAKSSTTAHQCELTFLDLAIPLLNPAGIQEFLDFGLYGWAMSRYSGCWIGFKAVTETVDTSASCSVDPHRIQIVEPTDFDMPEDGLNIRWPDPVLTQEERHHRYKLYAALAFARANNLNRVVLDSPKRRVGIIATGKAYLDVRQALDDLGIDEKLAHEMGLSLYKVGMSWPLDPQGVRNFCEGLDEVLVVEEKRAFVENQVKEQLYNWHTAHRPRIIGKFNRDYPDEPASPILPAYGELSPAQVARAIAALLNRHDITTSDIESHVAFLEQLDASLFSEKAPIQRLPYYCSGCPHNTSTKVPEGSRAMAGIGCHYMVQWMDRNTSTYTHMGGEGVTWVGQAPFTQTGHVFANLGDGTYYHSGTLAIRQAVAAGVNITYKLLYNDAVAMTGGQPVDGPLDPAMITRQLHGEGVQKTVVVSDEPEKYPLGTKWAPGVTVEHRDELDRIQRELRDVPGVTVLLYDQTCAAEKRRRRKRGTFPDPQKRVFINEMVCEGCGDCSVQSNCVSVQPKETEFGTKRTIDQSSCNKDFSCLKGFCPSFVTVHGGQLRKGQSAQVDPSKQKLQEVLPDPELPDLEAPYNILVTGIGGTGVVTISALLGMAAHIEGKGASLLDMAGLAQKGGAVLSHVRIAQTPEELHAVRISTGNANLILGCDNVVAAGQDTLSKVRKGHSRAVINSHETVTGDFALDSTSYRFPSQDIARVLRDVFGEEAVDFVDASHIATTLLGDSIASNLFMLGYAWQKGLIPLQQRSIEQAIELNAVAVDFNKQSFLWGRRTAHNPAEVEKTITPREDKPSVDHPQTLAELIERRAAFLKDYQNDAYAQRYRDLVERVRRTEADNVPGHEELATAVAHYAFKLMAYKDEYEVARLYSHPDFRRRLEEQFQGDYKLSIHLAPPLMAPRDPQSGHLRKKEYGPWVLGIFRVLAKMKGLRGTVFDPFGYTRERCHERQLIEDYFATAERLCENLDRDNHSLAVEIASLPDQIRGYGHIKEENIERARKQEAELMERFLAPNPVLSAAE